MNKREFREGARKGAIDPRRAETERPQAPPPKGGATITIQVDTPLVPNFLRLSDGTGHVSVAALSDEDLREVRRHALRDQMGS